jgi:hypothetical protein
MFPPRNVVWTKEAFDVPSKYTVTFTVAGPDTRAAYTLNRTRSVRSNG